MNKPTGGRGKQASYKSTHVRIPEPIKVRVEQLKELFFQGKLEEKSNLSEELDELYQRHVNSLTGNEQDDKEDKVIDRVNLEDSIKLAQKLLKQKKSARETVAKLLTGIYGVDIDPKSL